MTKQTRILGLLVAIAATTPALGAQAVKVTETKPGLLAKAKISADSAIALAKARLPKATISSAEIEEEDGNLIYSFDLKTAGKKGIDELNIDAMTGKVGKLAHESPEEEAKEEKAEKAEKDGKAKAPDKAKPPTPKKP